MSLSLSKPENDWDSQSVLLTASDQQRLALYLMYLGQKLIVKLKKYAFP